MGTARPRKLCISRPIFVKTIDSDGVKLTVSQGGKCQVVSWAIHEDETTQYMVRMSMKVPSNENEDSRKHYLSSDLVVSERILCISYCPSSKYNKDGDSTRLHKH